MGKFILKFIPLKYLPILALVLANVIWGGSFLVVKFTLDEFPVMTLAFLRFFLALILLSPFILSSKNQTKIKKEDLIPLIATGILMVTFNIAFFFEGLVRTSVTQASLLTLAVPFIAVLFGWWFLKEKVYVINLLGILLGLMGAAILIILPILQTGSDFTGQTLLGNILIILSDIAWVGGAAIMKPLMSKYSTLTITTTIFIVGTISFLIPAINEYIQNPQWIASVTIVGVLGLIYTAAGSSISAYFLFEWGLKTLGVIKADYFQYIEPLVAIILAIFLLSEKPQIDVLVAAVLIGLGGYWGTKYQESHKHIRANRT